MAGEGFSVEHGVEYARHDGVSLTGSLWRPRAAGATPAIVAIHGGGWQSGSSETYRYWGPWLAARGFALFTIRYRFSKPDRKAWPECFHDARAAVQFLKGRAGDLSIDPARISMMGDSAGGHLSAMVALAGDNPAFAQAYRDDPFVHISTKVRCVVGVFGVYDLAAQWLHDQSIRPDDHIVQRLMGFPPMDDRRAYFDATPMSYVERRNAQTSFLLAHGDEDEVVDRAQTDAFHFALRLAGFYTRRLIVGSAGHYFMQEPMEYPASTSAWLAPRALRFLQERG